MAEGSMAVPASCFLFATADWDDPYWTNKQQCAKSLAELGTQVPYAKSVGLRSPKVGSAKDWGRLWNRLRKGLASLIFGAMQHALGIFVLSPLLIPAGHRYPVTRAFNRLLLKIAIARTASCGHFECPLVWTYHPFMLDIIDSMKTGNFLYHCVDTEAIHAADAQLLKRDDLELPDHLRGMQVGLLPSLINDYTRGMFPKYYEHLAAGLPVVSTLLYFAQNVGAGLVVADTAGAFVTAVECQLARGRLTPDAANSLVGENTWFGRMSRMLGMLETDK